MDNTAMTPRQLGYRFPAEFEPHEAMWLSWPHNPDTWPGKIETIYPSYCAFIKEVTKSEEVRINVVDEAMKVKARQMLHEAGYLRTGYGSITIPRMTHGAGITALHL